MAELDPLDRLVCQARQEVPPPCSEADAAMHRVRAAGAPRAAQGRGRWRVAAALLAASAAAAAVLLVARAFNSPEEPAAPRRTVEVRMPSPELHAKTESPAEDATALVPALDILGSIDREIDQLMDRTDSSQNVKAKS